MSILTRGLETELTTGSNPYTEIQRPFRFSLNDQLKCMDLIPMVKHIQASEEGKHIDLIARYIIFVLSHKVNQISEAKFINAASTLPNLAWHEGPHLTAIFRLANDMLLGKSPLIAQEFAASALKNAVALGDNAQQLEIVTKILNLGFPSLRRMSTRVADGGLRSLLYASENTTLKSSLNTLQVKAFLQAATQDSNPFIVKRAQEAAQNIFGISV